MHSCSRCCRRHTCSITSATVTRSMNSSFIRGIRTFCCQLVKVKFYETWPVFFLGACCYDIWCLFCQITLCACGTSRRILWWLSLEELRVTAMRSWARWVHRSSIETLILSVTNTVQEILDDVVITFFLCNRRILIYLVRRLCHVAWITHWSCGESTLSGCRKQFVVLMSITPAKPTGERG